MRLPRHPRSAFTLVEMLVSITVLTVLIFLISQVFRAASITSDTARSHLISDSIARSIFDRMAYDFGHMLHRPDSDLYLQFAGGGFDQLQSEGPSGNDEFYFFTEAPGYPGATGPGASTVSLVGYQLDYSFQVQRFGKRFGYTSAVTAGAPAPTPVYLNPVPPGGASTNTTISVVYATDFVTGFNKNVQSANPAFFYDPIANGVLRMEVYYQLRDGSFSHQPFLQPPRYSITDGLGLSDVSAIVVSLAVIDPAVKNNEFAQLQDAFYTSETAAKLLPHFPAPGNPGFNGEPPGPLESTWEANWNKAISTNSTGLPPTVAKQVFFYQRFFYLDIQ